MYSCIDHLPQTKGKASTTMSRIILRRGAYTTVLGISLLPIQTFTETPGGPWNLLHKIKKHTKGSKERLFPVTLVTKYSLYRVLLRAVYSNLG